MALDVTVTTTIPRRAEEVAAYLEDPRHDPEWIGGLVEVKPPAGPLQVGTSVERVAKFMGRRIEYVLEVEQLERGRLLRMRAVKAPFPMEVTYQVAPEDGGSSVSLRVAGGPGGLARLFAPVMSWQVRTNLQGDLRRLRLALSAQPAR